MINHPFAAKLPLETAGALRYMASKRMPYYQYTASDNNGKMHHGTIYGMDKADLVAQLTSQGLFMVSFVEQERTATTPSAAGDAGELRTDDGLAARRGLSPRQLLFTVIAIGIGVLIGGFRAYQHRHPKETTIQLNAKLAQIRQLNDLSRANIDAILGRPASYDLMTRKARYFVSDDMGVEITYTADNRLDKTIGIRVLKDGR